MRLLENTLALTLSSQCTWIHAITLREFYVPSHQIVFKERITCELAFPFLALFKYGLSSQDMSSNPAHIKRNNIYMPLRKSPRTLYLTFS